MTSAWVDVKVVNNAKITEVTKVALSNKLTYVSANETGVKVAVTEVKNFGGSTLTTEDKGFSAPAVESIKSSDETVLYTNSSNELVARKAGKVTLTVKFVGIEKAVTLDVEVKTAQEATSISEAVTKTSKDGAKLTFKTLDANKAQLVEPAASEIKLTAIIKPATGDAIEVKDIVAKDFAAGKAVTLNEGKYTVEVKAGAKVIGTYTLEVVDTANAKADAYKIVTTDGKALELDVNGSPTGNLKVETYSKEVLLAPNLNVTSEVDFVVESSDKTIATAEAAANGGITVTGKKAGTVTITLKTKSAQYTEAVATFTVTVKNTTAQVTSIALVDKAVIKINESDVIKLASKDTTDEAKKDIKSAIKTQIVANVKTNVDAFTAEMIKDVEVTAQGTVIVTIADVNGGLEKALPFTLVDDVKPTITSAKIGSAEATITTNTIEFKLDAATKYTTGTVATSEAVSAVITYGTEKPVTLNNVNVEAILEVFKAKVKEDDILGSTLIGETITVELVDASAAKNSTTYTVTFTAK